MLKEAAGGVLENLWPDTPLLAILTNCQAALMVLLPESMNK